MSLAAAAAALRAGAEATDELLAGLPAPAERDDRQRARAAQVHRTCRQARASFLLRFVEQVYHELTGGGQHRLRLVPLVDAAAQAYPGLVPTGDQLAADRKRDQPAKEGREIDLGILFSAVLGSPVAGHHLLQTMLTPTPRSWARLPAFRRDGRADLGLVSVVREDGVGYVIPANHRYLNAEDDDLCEDLETAVDLVLLDDEIRVGVLRGAPMTHHRYAGRRVFNTGINLTHLYHGQISYLDFMLRRELGYVHKLSRGLLVDPAAAELAALTGAPGATVEKPWLAVVEGFAIGGGMQLLLVVDRVLAAAGAQLSLPAANEGVIPGVANLRLAHLAGGRLARQLILGGRKLRADEPDARLICDEVRPAAELDGAVPGHAAQLGQPAVAANRGMLQLAREPLDTFREHLSAFAIRQVQRMYSADLMHTLEERWRARARAR